MKNFRKHQHKSNNFTVIPNNIFKDNRLSLKAKGLLCQLLSLPSDWEFSENGLAQITKDGRTSIRSSMQELEECGYLHRERERDEKGRLKGTIYHIYEEPFQPTTDSEGNTQYSPVPDEFYYDWME
jgi:hypothetical protein